ncbi:hypothetical protein SDJN02_02092, partial [Cucurbita argyrosperma subsp. argyrosperma]
VFPVSVPVSARANAQLLGWLSDFQTPSLSITAAVALHLPDFSCLVPQTSTLQLPSPPPPPTPTFLSSLSLSFSLCCNRTLEPRPIPRPHCGSRISVGFG